MLSCLGSLVSSCADHWFRAARLRDYDRRCSGRSASSRVRLRSKTGPCGVAMPAEARGGCVERHANPSLADIDEPVRTIGIVASADAVLEPAGRWLAQLSQRASPPYHPRNTQPRLTP